MLFLQVHGAYDLSAKQLIPSGSSVKNFSQSNAKIIDVIVLVMS